MFVHQGYSLEKDAAVAVADATRGWDTEKAPEILFAFVSTAQDVNVVASTLAARFPATIVVGCTSTGEHAAGKHLAGSLVLAALSDTGIKWTVALAKDLNKFDAARADAIAAELFAGLHVNTEEFDPSEYFCLNLIDGLRMKEEGIVSLVAEALQGVRLVGGSAGDDLAFKETRVIAFGEAVTDAAVFILGHGKGAFQILKHQHFTTTASQLVVTKVDTAQRRVYEIDGLGALEAYAKSLGLAVDQVTSDVTFLHPVTFSCNGQIYVRSIQRVESDGSIVFYCAVEEGMVLEVGGHHNMVEELAKEFASAVSDRGPFEFFLGWNCILRALEADKTAQTAAVAELWSRVASASIGFDTYGEQLDGVHINQTLVAIGFHKAA